MNNKMIEQIETAVKNIKELERLEVDKSHPLYREQIDKLVSGAEDFDTETFNRDIDNVAGFLPPIEDLVDNKKVAEHQEAQLEKLKGIDQSSESYKDSHEEEPVDLEDITRLVNTIEKHVDVEDPNYKRQFKNTLEGAIQRIAKHRGDVHSDFGYISLQGVKDGTIKKINNGLGIEVQVGNISFTINNLHGTIVTKFLSESKEPVEEEKDMTVDEVKNLIDSEDKELERIKQKIDNKLEDKDELTDSDYNDMRHYLKRKNSLDNTIDDISNRGVRLAWNFQDYKDKKVNM